jgi:2-hydroxychromene-2-carboxylate isomerase
MQNVTARWYFDVISPFAYLHLKQFARLHPALSIEFVPVLFAGLLKTWGTKGPAELPAKRVHTYRQCVWLAGHHGIPFQMPPRHPFNPLSALRLLIALGSTRSAVERAFDFVWADGRDPELEFTAFAAALGVADPAPLIADPQVKAALISNTEQATQRGVWGVPTFEVRGELFWGADTIDWLNEFVVDPALFTRPGMRRADTTEAGVVRRT